MTKSPLVEKSFVKGAFVLTVAGVAIKIIGAINKIYISRLLGGEGIGLYQMAYLVYSVMTSLATAGIPTAISILIAQQLAVSDGMGVLRIRKVSFWVVGTFGCLCSLFLYGSADYLVTYHIVYDERAVLGIQLVAPALWVTTLVSSFRGYFQGFQNMVPTATSQLFEQLVRVLTMFGLAYMLLPYGLTYAAAGAAFSAVPSALTALLILLAYYYGQRKTRREYYSKVKPSSWHTRSLLMLVKELLRIAIPVSIASIMLPIINMVDLVVVPRRLVEALGYSVEAATTHFGYLTGMASSLINLPIIFTMSLAASLVPSISESYALGVIDVVRKKTEMALKMTWLFTLPATIGMMVLATPISTMLYATPYAGGAVFVLSLSIIFLGLQQVTAGVLQGLGYAKLPMRNLALGMVAKVVLTWFLVGVPRIAIEGAAWGTNLGFALAAVLNIYYIYQHTAYRIPWLEWGRIATAGLLMAIVTDGTYRISVMYVDNAIAIFSSIFLAIFTYGISLFIVRAMVWQEVGYWPVVGKYIVAVKEKYEKK